MIAFFKDVPMGVWLMGWVACSFLVWGYLMPIFDAERAHLKEIGEYRVSLLSGHLWGMILLSACGPLMLLFLLIVFWRRGRWEWWVRPRDLWVSGE